jgi:hypothetical protein
MINESTAVIIATRFLHSRGIDVEGFAHATYLPDLSTWACCFLKKSPNDTVDAPGMTIVNVNCLTGEPSFFEAL